MGKKRRRRRSPERLPLVDEVVSGKKKVTAEALVGMIADIMKEANYWAQQENAKHISAAHVEKALDEKKHRSSLVEERVQELVKKEVVSHADPDLRMFYGLRTKDLQFKASVKAWSMISWLFDKHRERFMKWLNAVGREGKEQEAAFQEVFGWSFEEVDIAWREFIRENW